MRPTSTTPSLRRLKAENGGVLLLPRASQGRTLRLAKPVVRVSLCCDFRRDLPLNLVEERLPLLPPIDFVVLAPVDSVEALFGCGSQPFQLRPILFLALLQRPKSFAAHLARAAEPVGDDVVLEERVEVSGQVYISGRHGSLFAVIPASLAMISSRDQTTPP